MVLIDVTGHVFAKSCIATSDLKEFCSARRNVLEWFSVCGPNGTSITRPRLISSIPKEVEYSSSNRIEHNRKFYRSILTDGLVHRPLGVRPNISQLGEELGSETVSNWPL